MFTLRLVGGFCVRVVVFYGLLMVPWPGLQDTYARCFRAAAEVVFGSFGPGGLVSFEPRPAPHPLYDTNIVLQTRHSPAAGRIPSSARYMGYVPTAFVVALVLATPIRWRRRWLALCRGLVLVNAYAVARVALTLVNGYSGDYPWALFKFPAFWKQVLSFIDEVVFLSLAGVYLVPIFIWMVASFRRDDLNSILNRDRLRVRPDTGSGRDMGGAKKVIVRGE